MEELKQNLIKILFEFCKKAKDNYKIGDESFYGDYKAHKKCKSEQHTLNSYLKTEADLKTKLSSFLSRKLSNEYLIHNELKIYKDYPRKMADITIHNNLNKLWLRHDEDIVSSLIAIIEIKYPNCTDPDFDFREGKKIADKTNSKIEDDMNKLKSIKNNKVIKILFILDESYFGKNRIKENIDQVKSPNEDILVISNNRDLVYPDYILKMSSNKQNHDAK